jgi:histidinol-phosphate aminotransferase
MSIQIRQSVKEGNKKTTYINTKKIRGPLTQIDCSKGDCPWIRNKKMIKITLENLAFYGDNTLYEEFIQIILDRFQIEGITSKNIFLGHGSYGLLEKLIYKFIAPTKMLGVGPQFNEIPQEFILAGGEYKYIEGDIAFPMEDVLSEIRTRQYSVVYIDNPNNPMGYVLSKSTIEKIVNCAQLNDTLVIIDEAYGDFINDNNSAATLVPKYNNIIVVRSCSKFMGLAAARVGYMFMPTALAEHYKKIDTPFEPSPMSLKPAIKAMENTTFIEKMKTETKGLKEKMMRILKKQGFQILNTDKRSPILMVHKPNIDVVKIFEERAIIVTPGSKFYNTHNKINDSYCRLRIVPGVELVEIEDRLIEI